MTSPAGRQSHEVGKLRERERERERERLTSHGYITRKHQEHGKSKEWRHNTTGLHLGQEDLEGLDS